MPDESVGPPRNPLESQRVIPETPHFCTWCGKLKQWDIHPELEGHFSEEPAVVKAMDDLRTFAAPDSLMDTPMRQGGKVHKHGTVHHPETGEAYRQEVGGSMCTDCADAYTAERVARKERIAKLAEPATAEHAEKPEQKPGEGEGEGGA